MVFGVAVLSYLSATAVKRASYGDAGQFGSFHLSRVGVIELEVRLVDHLGAQHRRFDQLYRVIRVQSVIAGRQKTQIAHALVVQIVPRVAVAHGQRVVLAELIIDARADAKTVLRSDEDAVVRRDQKAARIYIETVDDVSVINVAILNIQEEGCFLAQRPAERPAEVSLRERRFRRGVGVAGIPNGIAEVGIDVSVQLVGARFREDFDAPIPELVVFGRERVLIDANLADGILARQGAAGETIDVNLSAARSSGWSGQRLQIGLQIVGIVRQGLQIGSPQHQGTRILGRVHAHLGARVFLHRNFLLFGSNLQLYVSRRVWRGAQIDSEWLCLLQAG